MAADLVAGNLSSVRTEKRALPHQCQRKMRERRQIARRSDCPLSRYSWGESTIQKIDQHGGGFRRSSRPALRNRAQPRENDGPCLGETERVPRPGRQMINQVALQALPILGVNQAIGEWSETGGDAVDQPSFADRVHETPMGVGNPSGSPVGKHHT